MSYKVSPTCLKSSIVVVLLLLLQTGFTQGKFADLDKAFQEKQDLLGKDLVVMMWEKDDTIVFKKETNGFVPMEVITGASGKDLVQVTSDISDWQVASNANYLVDSESFIKTKN